MAILKGPVNPVTTGITTFPELDNIQVATPNRHSARPSLLLDFANSRTMDPRVTFTRSSNATFYDGSVVLADQNLLRQSQDWSSLWGLNSSATTVTANSTAAPDGTNTATQFSIARTNSELHYSEQSFSLGGPVTVSAFFKANTHNFLNMAVYQAGFTDAYSVAFNLSTGAITKTTSAGSVSGVSSSITSVGNSWYRVTVTATFPSTAATYLIFATNSVSVPTYNYQGILEAYAGTIGNSFYVWGAQMENRPFATAYTVTTTTPISTYIPVVKTAGPDQPRFDVDPVTQESRGLLIEEQKTNLLVYSSEIGNASWSVKNGLFILNAAIAPDGTRSATMMMAANTDPYVYQPLTLNGTYTFSIWVKGVGNTIGKTGTLRTTGISSPFTLTGSWQRITYTGTQTPSATINVGVEFPDSGAAVGDMVLLWGAQMETGSYATSYIPTVASTATRAQDFARMTGSNFSSWFDGAEGTFFSEYSFYGLDAAYNNTVLHVNDGTENNYIALFGYGTAYGWVQSYGATSAGITVGGATGADTQYKSAVSYKTNDFAFTLNGATVGTDTTGPVPTNINQLYIGWRVSANRPLIGRIKKIAYYPVRLSNAEIVSMTTA